MQGSSDFSYTGFEMQVSTQSANWKEWGKWKSLAKDETVGSKKF